MASPTQNSAPDRCQLAVQLAKEGGKLALSYLLRREAMEVEYPSRNDLVTEADFAVEDLIRHKLNEYFPNDGICGEERGIRHPVTEDDGYWVIDAIDGSVNYLHQIPFWSVSIAYIRNHTVELGVIYNPVNDELFSAQHNMGAYLNGFQIKVSNTDTIEQAIIGMGHAFRTGCDYFSQLEALTRQHADYRRLGSCALSMAHVACGRLDGYYEAYLPVWDFLAGWLLVKEAGGQVFPLPLDVLRRGAEVKVLNGKLNRFQLFPDRY